MDELNHDTTIEELPQQPEPPKKKMPVWAKVLIMVGAACLIAVFSAILTLQCVKRMYPDIGQEMELRYLISNYYDGEADEQMIRDGKIAGMMAGLEDPHSYYVPADIQDAYQEAVTGEYAGIGVEMRMEEDGACITRVFPDSPALEAGVQKGDYIVSVNGESAAGETLDWISLRVRGQEGTEVRLGILRDGKEAEYTITRKKIETPSVTAEMLEDNILYVSITQFDVDTHLELEHVMEQNASAKAVIVDLRDNPGGILDVCCDTIDPFLGKADIVIARYKDDEKVYTSDKKQPYTMPMAVLINENSASSSEIFAACMQDNHRAVIVGAKSYGKGSIQSSFSLQSGVVNLTIGHFYSPDDKKIDGVGVTPDVEIPYTEEAGKGYDSQLQAAINELKK